MSTLFPYTTLTDVYKRQPGRDGLSWAVRYDPGTDPAAPAVTAATDQFVAGHVAATEGTS